MREIFCQKLHKNAEGLLKPPYPNALGQKIYDHISKEAWAMWMDQQTKLINENRLDLLNPDARQFLLKEMQQFLFDTYVHSSHA